jgi:hypothetical protein
MSKRKSATKLKHTRGPKVAAKAQRAVQAIIRSPKDSRLRTVGAASPKSSPERSSEPAALADESTTTALHQGSVEPAISFQGGLSDVSTIGFDFSLASANVRAFQGKLLEVAHANMQFALEFAQRLAAIKSPAEFLAVTAEFTGQRSVMFRKHSKEIAELILATNRKKK